MSRGILALLCRQGLLLRVCRDVQVTAAVVGFVFWLRWAFYIYQHVSKTRLYHPTAYTSASHSPRRTAR